jgi:alkylation response protein AidB-like acyl-CoA dehydrogenase
MDFSLTDEQTLLQDTFERLFREESTSARIRATETTGFDPALWDQVAVMGAPVMRVPETLGGGGCSLLDAVLVVESAGRHLASIPLVESIVTARLLADLNTPQALSWLSRVAREGTVVTLALHAVAPAAGQDRQLISGGGVAQGIIALRGTTLLLLPPADGPVGNLGQLALAYESLAVGGEVLAEGPEAVHRYHAAVEEWTLLTATLIASASRRVLELAADYAKERQAFGKPIGAYQGLAHPLADSWTDIDGARLLIWRAVWALAHDRERAAAAISMAYWWTTDAAAKATVRATRAFGGYGMTLEYDAQLYFRRARAWSLLKGDPQPELERLGDRLWTDHKTALPAPGPVSIDIDFSDDAKAFGAACAKFFDETMTEELRAFTFHSTDGHDLEMQRKLAARGFLFPDWPAEYGGQGRTRYEMSMLRRAFGAVDWWVSAIGVTNLVGKIVAAFGSEEVKREILPQFASGEFNAALGYSEPSGGSDIFAAKTRADWNGSEWLVNGQKMFTSHGHLAQYGLLIVRTNHEVKTLGGERTNTTFYTDVKVPDRYRLGPVDGGAKVMAYALTLEQSAADYYVSALARQLRHALAWANTGGDAAPIQRRAVRARLARAQTLHDITDLLGRRCLWSGVTGQQDKSFGPMAKLFGSEAWVSSTTDLVNLAAPHSLLTAMSDLGVIEQEHRKAMASTIYAGTSEVLRSIIAESALGLPRSRM